MLHLFANNAQCKHLILGCSHNGAYTVPLERYVLNPITASRITLLRSYEINFSIEGLPFETVEFPRVFRSTPYKETDVLAGENDIVQGIPQSPGSNPPITANFTKSDAQKAVSGREAIAKWQATADAFIPVSAPTRSPAKTRSGWATEKKVLLNINDERVDQELGEVDHETSESMLDRMEVRRFCVFHHLQGSCMAASSGSLCNFVHGPALNDDELRFLKQHSRRLPCASGSRCRRSACLYGHVCPDQPGCTKGSKCKLFAFHKVDKTVVSVWSPEKSLSPAKRRLKVAPGLEPHVQH